MRMPWERVYDEKGKRISSHLFWSRPAVHLADVMQYT